MAWGGGVDDGSRPINIPWRVWIHHAYEEGGDCYGPPKCRSGVLCALCADEKVKSRVGWYGGVGGGGG